MLFVEIKPPGSPDGPPAAADVVWAVAKQWQDYRALIVSFLGIGIGIYWLQHYYSGRLYAKSDHTFSLINLGFLFGIMALPYPAGLWAHHLGTSGEAAASRILAALLFMPSLFWMLKWLYAKRGERLIDPPTGARLRTANDAALHDRRVRAGAAACAHNAKVRLGTEFRRHRILDTAAAHARYRSQTSEEEEKDD